MRLLSCLAAAVIGALGCGGDDATTPSGLVVSVRAATPGPRAECETNPESDFDPAIICALISICERADGAEDCQRLEGLPPDLFVVTGTGPFEFEIPWDGLVSTTDATYEITTVLYDQDGRPRYEALRTNLAATELTGAVRTRAYLYETSSCAGPNLEAETFFHRLPRERAFHEATRLPNGDVLIYGGIRGSLDASSVALSSVAATPQTYVEVYRADEDRLEVLDGVFSRVLFASVLLTTDPAADVYRIYVSGGFDAAGGLLRFDESQDSEGNFYGLPLMPGENAEPQDDTILVYDRAAGTITVESAARATAGAIPSAPTNEDGLAPVIGGVIGAPFDDPWSFVRDNNWIDTALGTSAADAHSIGNADRFGHTVGLLPSGDALVWGGNIATESALDLEATAGQVVSAAGAVTDLAYANPVAFHTMTPDGAGGFLVVGGQSTACLVDVAPCGDRGVAYDVRGISRIGFDIMDALEVTPVDDTRYRASYLHHALALPSGATLVTGGATCGAPPDGGTCLVGLGLTDSDQLLTVGPLGDVDTDGLPARLLSGRFGHRVTRLDVCPEGALDCDDPRYLVTGGMTRFESTLVSLRVAEVIYVSTGSRWLDLDIDTSCEIPAGVEL